MADHEIPILVRDRLGRPVLLEPDRLSRSLFIATESLGRPDPLFARELADGVAGFLRDEGGEPIAPVDFVELVTKFVRELGHPALALRYRDLHRVPATDRIAREDDGVFPRDVRSVVRDGLLSIDPWDSPLLAGGVMGAGLDDDPTHAAARARQRAARFVAIDGPEYALVAKEGTPEDLATEFLNRIGDLPATMHLNLREAPPWSTASRGGPLFADVSQPVDRERLAAIAIHLARRVGSTLRVAWHLAAGESAPVGEFPVAEYVFDRGRSAVSLGAGLSREFPAALMLVGVHLPRLAEQLTPLSSERFLQKLASLARLARSAGHAKLAALRHQAPPALREGFLIDRARLVVVPIGLEEVVRRIVEHRLTDNGPGTAFGVQVIRRLRETLTTEPPHNLIAVLDSPPLGIAPFGIADPSARSSRREVAGITPWDAEASPRQQIRVGAALQTAAGGGRNQVLLPPAMAQDPVGIAALTRFAQDRGAHRVQFVTA